MQELKFLGRWIRLVDGGVEWECDPKHADQFIETLRTDFGGEDVSNEDIGASFKQVSEMKGSKTPGIKRTSIDEERIGLSPALANYFIYLFLILLYMFKKYFWDLLGIFFGYV